ncbi:MAG: GNAT family N-acetyltransferase [Gammaproteobacteria bacterium]|nr:GNAT family N-acetyltransferase [Gammaproteobacteria bacterium]
MSQSALTALDLAGPAAAACFQGRAVCLRELQASDRDRIQALLSQVDPSDLQMRFFGLFREVPRTLLDQLMRVDPAERLTVAAVREHGVDNHPAEILGVARAHRTAADSAEAALLVRSDLKGAGLGSLLLGRLIAQCRNWGLSRISAEVLPDNSRMLHLAKRYGFRCESLQEDHCHLVLELGQHGSSHEPSAHA